MAKKYLIRNGKVLFPDKEKEQKADILIDGKQIVEVGFGIIDAEAEVIDANGLYVFPGLIDMHVHLREPGQEYKEDIASGTAAAAAGGFTSVACMPNTSPVIDSPEMVRFLIDRINTTAKVNVFPVGAITKKLEGQELAEMGLMHREGAVTFSDDGKYVQSSEVMKNALLYAKSLGVTLISHSLDADLSDDGDMNEGYYSTILGLKGLPAVAEEIAVGRDIALAAKYGPVHITHVSTKNAVQMIKEAKKKGIPVTADTAPHYFWFTDESLQTYDTNFKMMPPLRTKEDVKAIIEGLKDGTIDAIATDHAPHTVDQKMCEFGQASFGVTGLETALGACLTKLYYEHQLPLSLIIKKLSINPARILKINKGRIAVDEDADITVVDLKKSYKVSGKFCSKSANSPFIGMELKGKTVYTFVGGKLVYKD